uniref:Uncharacterized protein n=1 Tax=Tanacetum cinerariifolium TaxID=118510 RepID=A0A6L2J1W0_TANCI|nr:hypothetical protein [Tanacetum cinerariifolium]
MDDDLFTYEVKILELSYSSSVKQQMDDLDNENLDIYERKLCYDECERMYAQAVIFINKKLVRLIDVTVEQRLDLKYSDHTMKMEKYCNGGDLPGVIQNGDVIYFEDYESYENLKEGELKEDALNSKAIFEKSKAVDKESNNNVGTYYSPNDEWEDFERVNYIRANANSNYNHLDVSRIFNDHTRRNNDYET